MGLISYSSPAATNFVKLINIEKSFPRLFDEPRICFVQRRGKCIITRRREKQNPRFLHHFWCVSSALEATTEMFNPLFTSE